MLLNILIGLAICQQPSEKELFDGYLNSVRPAQLANGSYADDVIVTANILTGMALSPRAYRVDDGPFIRDAVAYILKHQDDEPTWSTDFRIGMALMHVHRDKYLPTAQKLASRNGKSLDDFRSTTFTASTQYLLGNLPSNANLSQIASAVAASGMLRT